MGQQSPNAKVSCNLLLGSTDIAVVQSSEEPICESTQLLQRGNISRNLSQLTTLRVSKNENINSHGQPDLRNVVDQLFFGKDQILP